MEIMGSFRAHNIGVPSSVSLARACCRLSPPVARRSVLAPSRGSGTVVDELAGPVVVDAIEVVGVAPTEVVVSAPERQPQRHTGGR